jgi:hypothetical protein
MSKTSKFYVSSTVIRDFITESERRGKEAPAWKANPVTDFTASCDCI